MHGCALVCKHANVVEKAEDQLIHLRLEKIDERSFFHAEGNGRLVRSRGSLSRDHGSELV